MRPIYKGYHPTDCASVGWTRLHDLAHRVVGTARFRLACALFGVEAGKNVRCFGKVLMVRAQKSAISIGNDVTFISDGRRCTASNLFSETKLRTFSETSSIVIEDGVGLNGTSITSRSREIRIKSGTIVAPNVVIVDSDFHAKWPPENRAQNPGFEDDAPVTIGRNVWIGMGCLILKGVAIGDNSVVGAGSVVTRPIESNVLAVGNPARVVKRLNGPEAA